eukprot:1085230-Rhodomonas_salina.2
MMGELAESQSGHVGHRVAYPGLGTGTGYRVPGYPLGQARVLLLVLDRSGCRVQLSELTAGLPAPFVSFCACFTSPRNSYACFTLERLPVPVGQWFKCMMNTRFIK